MIINDLSYLESVEEKSVVGAGGFFFLEGDVNVDINVDKDIDAELDSDVDISGNFANLNGQATAFGNNTISEVDFEVFADPGFSTVAVSAVAAVD